MHEKQSTSSTAVVIIVVLLVGVGAIVLLGVVGVAAFFFLMKRDVAQPNIVYESKSVYVEPMDAVAAVPIEAPSGLELNPLLPMLQTQEDGSLLWNSTPVTLDELRERLQEVVASPDPATQGQIQYLPHPQAPAETSKTIHDLLRTMNIQVVGPAMLGPGKPDSPPAEPTTEAAK